MLAALSWSFSLGWAQGVGPHIPWECVLESAESSGEKASYRPLLGQEKVLGLSKRKASAHPPPAATLGPSPRTRGAVEIVAGMCCPLPFIRP